jgi:hypothetical protein
MSKFDKQNVCAFIIVTDLYQQHQKMLIFADKIGNNKLFWLQLKYLLKSKKFVLLSYELHEPSFVKISCHPMKIILLEYITFAEEHIT